MKKYLEKVMVDLDANGWHGFVTETMWAQRISEEVYQITNVPFFANGLGLNDVFITEIRNGIRYLKFVSKRSGHSTYRIFLSENITIEKFRQYWQPLEMIGCTYEKGQGRLFAIDVPPSADIYLVYGLLEDGEKNQIWEFEEGYCGHQLAH